MPSTAHAFIIGHLTRDPENKHLPSGKEVCNFGIAVDDGFGDKEHASFFDCVAWGRTAETVGKYTHKGSLVAVEGSPRQERWEKDGANRSKVVFTAFRVLFLDPKGTGGRTDDGDGPQADSSEPPF